MSEYLDAGIITDAAGVAATRCTPECGGGGTFQVTVRTVGEPAGRA